MADRAYNIACSKCGFYFTLRLDDIKQSTINLDGDSVLVSWFFCKQCGDVQIVSVEDDAIRELRDDYERAKSRFRTYVKLKDQHLIENGQVMIKRKHDRLSREVDKLLEKVKSKVELKYDGYTFELRLKSCL